MSGALSDYLDVYHMPASRVQFLLRQTHRLATEGGLDDIAAGCLAAQHVVATLREFEAAWERQKANPPKKSRAPALDVVLDRLVIGAHDTALAPQKALLAGHPLSQRSVRFIRHHFPNGPAPVIRLSYVEEGEWIGDFVKSTRTAEWADDVAALNLGVYIDELEATLPEFLAELEANAALLAHTDVRGARVKMHDALLSVVARILGRWPEPNQIAERARLLAPLDRQQAEHAESLRTRKRPTEVNPETGEVIDEPETPAEPVTPAV